MRDGRVVLDRDVFKALASDSRLDILQHLDQRNMTASELARALDLHKATVHEHLEKLQAVNLVDRIEDDRKWVYHRLTWTGRRLLHPERITFAILLATSVAAGVTGLVAAFLTLASGRAFGFLPPGPESAPTSTSGAAAPAFGAPMTAGAAATLPAYVPKVAAALLVLGVFFLVATVVAHSRVRAADVGAASEA